MSLSWNELKQRGERQLQIAKNSGLVNVAIQSYIHNNVFGSTYYKIDQSITLDELKKKFVTEFNQKRFANRQGLIDRISWEIKNEGKSLAGNLTLKNCGIEMDIDGPNAVIPNIYGLALVEWNPMYDACPVCVDLDRVKGYWYHPSANKAEFKSDIDKISDGNTVQILKDWAERLEDKLRCSGCKNINNKSEWVFKCANHDYKKIGAVISAKERLQFQEKQRLKLQKQKEETEKRERDQREKILNEKLQRERRERIKLEQKAKEMERKLNELQRMKQEKEEKKENENITFEMLLKQWNLSECIQSLIVNEGFADIEDVMDLSVDELRQLGLKYGHAKKLKRKVSEFMSQK